MTTITIERELLEQALEALTYKGFVCPARERRAAAINAIRAELAQPTQAQHDAPETIELKAQRDELLAALKEVMGCFKTHTSLGAQLRARAAIAKAEGGAA